MAGPSYANVRKLAAARAAEYSVVSQFKLGYRNREDVTNLPPGVLIVGSQNVLTNVSERVQIRQGYALDGPVSSVAASVLSSFDWLTKNNGEIHLRAGGLVSNDGKLQYRYIDSIGTVTWRDLMTDLRSVAFNFTTFWRIDESLRVSLFVDSSSNIYEWNGATATIVSSDDIAGHIVSVASTPTAGGNGYIPNDVLTIDGGTAGTVTVLTVDGSGVVLTLALASIGSGYSTGTGQATTGGSGTGATVNITQVGMGQITIGEAILDSGFYISHSTNLIINGTEYTYSGVFGSSFVGVSPDPTVEPVGSIIHQAVVITSNSSFISGPPTTFQNGLIRVLNNQIFLGALNSSALWISKVNSYTDYSSSTPRQSGEGATLILDSQLVGLEPQENFMYVTAGQDLWYNVSFSEQTSTVGVSYEEVDALPLKTGRQQAAFSQAYLSHMKNDIIVLTNEPTIDTFGRVETSLATPQQTNISDPIKLDVDSYDFTDGSIFYWRYYILVAVPKEGLVRIFNLNTKSWEAPQTIPISRFYIVAGELYGHSYNTFESYQLFVGYADRVYPGFTGFPIPANWVFSYESYGSRFTFKKSTKMYVEGYINANTTLDATITYELDGCQTVKTFTLDGSNQQFVCISGAEGSLGKESLGKLKLGGDSAQSIQGLPPKFRWFPTFDNTDFFECSVSFSVLGTNERMELLAFGLAASGSYELPVQKMD